MHGATFFPSPPPCVSTYRVRGGNHDAVRVKEPLQNCGQDGHAPQVCHFGATTGGCPYNIPTRNAIYYQHILLVITQYPDQICHNHRRGRPLCLPDARATTGGCPYAAGEGEGSLFVPPLVSTTNEDSAEITLVSTRHRHYKPAMRYECHWYLQRRPLLAPALSHGGHNPPFLRLNHAHEAVARVAQGVRQGGHNIPEAVIRRRFHAGLDNFHQHYAASVDAWSLYDNTGETPVLLEWCEQ